MKINILLGCFLLLPTICIAAKTGGTSVEFRSEIENWKSGLGGTTSALLMGAGVSHKFNEKVTITGGFISGKHNMDSDNGVKITRNDFDIAGLYQFQQPYFAFVGYRLIRLDVEDNIRPFKDNIHGLGIGVGGFLPVRKNIYAYARTSFSLLLSAIKYTSLPIDRGGGTSFGTEGGVIYQFKKRTNAALSVKYQSISVDYKNGASNWVNSYIRLGLSISHSFK